MGTRKKQRRGGEGRGGHWYEMEPGGRRAGGVGGEEMGRMTPREAAVEKTRQETRRGGWGVWEGKGVGGGEEGGSEQSGRQRIKGAMGADQRCVYLLVRDRGQQPLDEGVLCGPLHIVALVRTAGVVRGRTTELVGARRAVHPRQRADGEVLDDVDPPRRQLGPKHFERGDLVCEGMRSVVDNQLELGWQRQGGELRRWGKGAGEEGVRNRRGE